MKNSQLLWNNFVDIDKGGWVEWLTIATNGEVIPMEGDCIVYRNDELNKAINISYEKDGNFEFTYFFSDFNYNEIEILNIVTNNFEVTQIHLNKVIEDWLNGTLAEPD